MIYYVHFVSIQDITLRQQVNMDEELTLHQP